MPPASKSSDAFLLALLADLHPDADPWEDLRCTLTTNGLRVLANEEVVPDRPPHLFDAEGRLTVTRGDWRARESIIRRYRAKHVLEVADLENRSAETWRRYLQRLATAQLQRTDKAMAERAGFVAFDDPHAGYVIHVDGEEIPYQLASAYEPLLRTHGENSRERKLTGLYRAICNYDHDGGVDLAGYLTRTLSLYIANERRSEERHAHRLALRSESASEPSIEIQINRLAFHGPRVVGPPDALTALLERAQQGHATHVWGPLQAAARDTRDQELVRACQAAGQYPPDLRAVAAAMGRPASTIYRRWAALRERAGAPHAGRFPNGLSTLTATKPPLGPQRVVAAGAPCPRCRGFVVLEVTRHRCLLCGACRYDDADERSHRLQASIDRSFRPRFPYGWHEDQGRPQFRSLENKVAGRRHI